MSEPILKALMQLFALISNTYDYSVITSREKDIVRLFLTKHLNNEQVDRYMKMYEEYLRLYSSGTISKGSIRDRKRTSLNAMRILAICQKINEELQIKQKIYVLVKLMDYISSGEEITDNELDFIQTVANAFFIDKSEYENISAFILGSAGEIPRIPGMLVIDSMKGQGYDWFKHICDENIKGAIHFLQIASSNTYIMRYSGTGDLVLNSQNISRGETYIFDHGSSLRGSGINPVYYSEVESIISGETFRAKVTLDASNVSFKFRNSENGIQNLNIHEESGRLVGILGGSGVGKSTTLSILNGTLRPQSGAVLINGYNLYNDFEREFLKGVIGFVPQDDLLIEDLTVYQNLYYNARMCLNDLPEKKIIESVNQTLIDLELEEVRDLKVGNPLKKIISGGQRKRVNIALELLREPTILFIDEPTSGLSSIDSEVVMNLLKQQTYKGKLVVVNIHQPGSDLYKMFDKVMIMDRGGYQIYYGNPSEAIVYFKTLSNQANPDEDQCARCGNINTDKLLQIIEAKVVDERGRVTRTRKVFPREWAEKYQQNSPASIGTNEVEKKALPENYYSIPGFFKQSKIFFIRDFFSKVADKQYIIMSLLGSPVLALILSYFTRYTDGASYTFRGNDNVPAYLFMCVITSLFFGLMISSEEIIKDRKILKRESFLNLSWFSYLNSKVLIMFLLSAIQTISFVIIGNLILGIRGMTISYWLVLFTTACFANLLGLNISSAFNSVITIYILIPFILIPQLLFSGVIVNFNKLHLSDYTAREYVPVIGDLMVTRWSFEALAVRQFKNNRFEMNFVKYDIEANPHDYFSSFLIDALENNLHKCLIYKDSVNYTEIVNDYFSKVIFNIDKLSGLADTIPGEWRQSLNICNFSAETEKRASEYLEVLKKKFRHLYLNALKLKEEATASLVEKIGREGFINLREQYENEQLNFLVLNEDNRKMTVETRDRIIQKYKPGFMRATSKYGRAHFYTPVKNIGSVEIDTYWFNILVIWIVSIVLYIILYFNLPEKAIKNLSAFRLRKYGTQ